MTFRRSVKLSIASLGPRDRRQLDALLQAYRAAVNFFIRLLWRDPGAGFNTATSKRLERTRLSGRYRDQALKQAIDIVKATKKSAHATRKAPGRPFFRGMAILDSKFVRFEARPDRLVIHLACLRQGRRMAIPTKRTSVLDKWLTRRGAHLVRGCGLTDGDLLQLWVEVPEPEKRVSGRILGVDVGASPLLATSDGEFLGLDFRAVMDKVRRRRPGSKGKRRARVERDDQIRLCSKRLPWGDIRALAYEDLSGIKLGKRKGRSRSFRRRMASWRPQLVEARLNCLAAENGVLALSVPGWGNSTTCPGCSFRSRRNRNGSLFRCGRCGLVDDADHVGALAAKQRGESCIKTNAERYQLEQAREQARREARHEFAALRAKKTAEKWRSQRERTAAVVKEEESSIGANIKLVQHGSAVSGGSGPDGPAPVQDPSGGGASIENAQGECPRGTRRMAARRGGEEPPTRGSPGPGDNCRVESDDVRVPALDVRASKPSNQRPPRRGQGSNQRQRPH